MTVQCRIRLTTLRVPPVSTVLCCSSQMENLWVKRQGLELSMEHPIDMMMCNMFTLDVCHECSGVCIFNNNRLFMVTSLVRAWSAEEKRWVFSWLRRRVKTKMSEREEESSDHRSDLLKGSLLQSHWWTWSYIMCASFIAQFCLGHCCPWISVCGVVFLIGLWCLNVVVLVRLVVLHHFMLQWIVTHVYGCCVCLSWYKCFNSEESRELCLCYLC